MGDPQIEAGFICTCQAYATGPGIVVELGAYDEVYESQYGQFERSYGDLKFSKKWNNYYWIISCLYAIEKWLREMCL